MKVVIYKQEEKSKAMKLLIFSAATGTTSKEDSQSIDDKLSATDGRHRGTDLQALHGSLKKASANSQRFSASAPACLSALPADPLSRIEQRLNKRYL